MTQLLVSVRSASEAEAALRGGAKLIDVKEPKHGSLGRARDGVISEVARTVAGRCPISAANGELIDFRRDKLPPAGSGLVYVKWGLSGYRDGGKEAWQPELLWAMNCLQGHESSCRPVAVAYADWQRAGAPRPEDVCSFAVENSTGAFLIDTWRKDGSTLLDWLSLGAIESLRGLCSAAGVPIAFAGSLGPAEIRTLLPLCPDWIAVRGAICQGKRRESVVEEGKVRMLAELLVPPSSAGAR
ncbi:MAG TPA: (5-formylfuran-3-yl)methyl phosphate synthase [Gemmataceae bacterium]|jgi:uncharacterized protein (UPF0264 family)